MNRDKVKVKLSGVSQTLLFPLWERAQFSKKYSSLFYDEKAIELAEKIEIDYDLSTNDVPFQLIMFNAIRKLNLPEFGPSLFVALRAKQFDDKTRAFLTEYPHASVVNIGAGLDTTFYRVDNGLLHWYDLDLPAVIDVRRQLLPEPDRVTYIAKSLLDPSWCKTINIGEGVFMIAGGVFMYFEESQVKQFFSMLADNFADAEIVFDTQSKLGTDYRAWSDQFPPELRDAMQAAQVDALKDWWQKAPQDQKDTLDGMITALKTTTTPKGKEWTDIDTWWNQISDKEKAETMVGLIGSSRRGSMKWTLEDASEITKWDSRITVIDQFPTFKNIPRDSLSKDMRKLMDYAYDDERNIFNIIHLRV